MLSQIPQIPHLPLNYSKLKLMEYETTLNQALDLLADGEEKKAGKILQSCIDDIKKNLKHTDDDLMRYYYWGRCLTAMEEVEQALLKFEKVLKIDPDHEASLWETASIFFHDMDRPENAEPILAERLLKIDPENELYIESLQAVRFALKLRKSPPPMDKEESESMNEDSEHPKNSDDIEDDFNSKFE